MHPGYQVAQVHLCLVPIDFRKSINGLSVLVEQELGLDPFGQALYVFINRQRNKIKVLYWHRNGFCLWLKRLEAEKFAWPRDGEAAVHELTAQQFEWLLEGCCVPRYRRTLSQIPVEAIRKDSGLFPALLS
jgi:transposase